MKRLLIISVLLGMCTPLCFGLRELKQSTAVTVTVGPIYDDGDHVTRVTSIDAAEWTCQFFKNDANSEITITASGGDNDAVLLGMGRCSLELTTGNTDTLGHLTMEITDPNGDPFTEYFAVIDPNEWNRKYSTGEIDIYSVSGSKTAADNLEDFVLNGYDAANNGTNVYTIRGEAPADGNGVTLTDQPWNHAWDAEVQSEVSDELTNRGYSSTIAGYLVNVNNANLATLPAITGDAYARLGAPAGASVSADIAAVKSDTAATLSDTGTDGVVVASGSKTGYSLSSSQTFNMTGNITGNLSGSVGSVTGNVGGNLAGSVGSVTGNVGGNVVGSVASVTNAVTANTTQIEGVDATDQLDAHGGTATIDVSEFFEYTLSSLGMTFEEWCDLMLLTQRTD